MKKEKKLLAKEMFPELISDKEIDEAIANSKGKKRIKKDKGVIESLTPKRSKKDYSYLTYDVSKSYFNSGHIIAGLDLSLSGTGIVIMNSKGDILAEKLIRTKKTEIPEIERLKYIKDELMSFLMHHKVSMVAVEHFSYGSTGRSVYQLGALGGIIRLTLLEAKIPFVEISPNSLKAFITTKGKAEKDDMRDAVMQRYNLNITDNNICDAFGLARFLLVMGTQISEFIAEKGTEKLRYLREKKGLNIF